MTGKNLPLSSYIRIVAAALIDPDWRVMVQLRPAGRAMAGHWEFPGGKIEPGKTPEAALARELSEELGIAVPLDEFVPVATSIDDSKGRLLALSLYAAHQWGGTAEAKWADSIAWMAVGQLHELHMPPADTPLIAPLENYLAMARS